MAKVTNAFIKSKMNQDLDARLLPNGEYREGLNIQVSKSEGPDVGALENVLGNILLGDVDLKSITGIDNIKVIGNYVDKSTDTVFLFLTDYTDEVFADSKVNFKYEPTASNFIYSFNVTTHTLIKLVEGAFLNFSTTHPIIGVNVLEDLLFFTDNRNQPRKINVSLANPDPQNTSPTYYSNEDNISVAKYNPYEAIQLYKNQDSINAIGTTMIDATSQYLPNGTTDNPYYDENYAGDPDFLKDKFVRFSYRFKFNDGEYSLLAPFTQEAFIPEQDGYFLGVVSESGANVPFTSTDEQDTYRSSTVGFMENKANEIELLIPLPSEQIEYIDSVAKFNGLKVLELDIIYKESDGLAVQVVDTITIEEINSKMFSTVLAESYDSQGEKQTELQWFYPYKYQGRKPYKTLPEAELIRVYDKVPVRAFSQEVSGNRIIYGNFQDKHTPPVHLNYNVAVSDKYPLSVSEAGVPKNKSGYRTSSVEYPMHTVKQNRNYQVGVVLSDRFGRSSTVVLSSVNQPDDVLGKFYGSTTYHPYFDKNRYDNDKVADWAGDSIKMVFNDQIGPINPSYRTGWPGIYNGNPDDPNYNPLGWYSYKIVVKQTEQEYYNVYTGGIIEGDPNSAITAGNPIGTTATVSLISDNINKVPKDVTDIGPEQKQFRSEVTLFPRVTPNYVNAVEPSFNEPFFPTSKGAGVPALAEYKDIFLNAQGESIDPLPDVYESTTNPLVARLSTSKAGEAYSSTVLGSFPKKQANQPYPYFLGVLETNPVVSRLEIFWETSTTGLVNDLNYLVANSENDVAIGLENFSFNLREDDVIGTVVTGNFYPETTDATGFVPINDSILNSWDVFNPQDESVKDKFDVVKVDKNQTIPGGGTLAYDSYHIKTKKEFVYSSTSPSTDNYEFVFNFSSVASPDANTDFVQPNNRLRNVNPTILASDGDPNTELPTTFNINVSKQSIYEFKGVNGTISNVDSAKQVGLEWSIQGDTNNNFSIGADTGILFTTTDDVGGTFNLTVVLKDAGGQVTHDVQVIADVLTNDDGVPNYEKVNDDVWCTNNISTISFGNIGSPFTIGKALGEGVFITKNQQSTGYFWVSDPSNAQNNEPFDRSAGILNPLPATISADGDVVFQNMVNTECSDYTFSNANFTSKSNISTSFFGDPSNEFWLPALNAPYVGPAIEGGYTQTTNPNPNDFQTTNLKEGSMFIQVRHSSGQFNYFQALSSTGYKNYYCNQGFSGNSIAELGVPIVLQYRDTESPDYPNNWVTAIDVEGNECLFGGTQQASVQPRLTFSDTYNGTGVILNKDSSTLTIGDAVASVIPPQNISQVNFQLWKADSDRDLFTNAVDPEGIYSTGQPASEKVNTFVIGKDQSYFGEPKYGDYRLLIRYPFGTFPAPVSSNTNCGNNTSGLLTPTPTNCNEKIKNPVAAQYRLPRVYLSYGDFYNPVGVDRACMENSGAFDLQNPISYAYKIGDINWESALEASYDDPAKEVYAREWHCKYVTRFYEDEKCTKLLNFTGYRSFSPLGNPVVGKVNTEATLFMPAQTFDLTFGYNRSDNSHAHGKGEELIISPRDTNDDRRWIAEFKSGKKVKGTSKPSDFVSKDSSIQSRKIVYGDGKIIETSESLSTNSSTLEKEITGSLQVTAGQNINAPIKLGVSINKGNEGGPILGPYGQTTGYICTFGAQDVAETILSVESVGRIIIRSNKWPTPSDGECTTTTGYGGCAECTRKMGTDTQYSSNQTFLANYEPENIEVEVDGEIIPIDEWATKGFLTVPAGQIYSYSLVQRYAADSSGTMVYATSTIFEL